MAKTTGPLLSLGASGSVAKTLTFASWKGITYVRQLVKPTYTNTVGQVNVRDLMSDASIAWKTGATVGAIVIDAAYKLAYNSAAAGFAYSGFNLFMKQVVALNDGSAYDGSLAIPVSPTA